MVLLDQFRKRLAQPDQQKRRHDQQTSGIAEPPEPPKLPVRNRWVTRRIYCRAAERRQRGGHEQKHYACHERPSHCERLERGAAQPEPAYRQNTEQSLCGVDQAETGDLPKWKVPEVCGEFGGNACNDNEPPLPQGRQEQCHYDHGIGRPEGNNPFRHDGELNRGLAEDVVARENSESSSYGTLENCCAIQ